MLTNLGYGAAAHAGARPDIDAGWLSGSCLVVRREAFEVVGGVDEGFFMFMEPVDLGRRLGRAGYRCRWVPGAAVTHVGGHSWRGDPAPMILAHHAAPAHDVGLAFPRLVARARSRRALVGAPGAGSGRGGRRDAG